MRIVSYLTQQIRKGALEFSEASHLTQQMGKDELEFEGGFSPDPADRKG